MKHLHEALDDLRRECTPNMTHIVTRVVLTSLAAEQQRNELLEALREATEALSGGLWDYGPGQDEHTKCNEVIERCSATIAKVAGSPT